MNGTEVEQKLEVLYQNLDTLRLAYEQSERKKDYTKNLRILNQISDIENQIDYYQKYSLKLIKKTSTAFQQVRPPIAYDMSKEFDFFISHASEDKESIARPLYEALNSHCAKVWFDEKEITIGDSLRQKIEQGLKQSRYGIVIISKTYMEKFWTEKELNGLFSKWAGGDDKVILPIWHHVSKDEILNYSPILADIRAFKSSDYTIDELADGFKPLIRQ